MDLRKYSEDDDHFEVGIDFVEGVIEFEEGLAVDLRVSEHWWNLFVDNLHDFEEDLAIEAVVRKDLVGFVQELQRMGLGQHELVDILAEKTAVVGIEVLKRSAMKSLVIRGELTLLWVWSIESLGLLLRRCSLRRITITTSL